MPVASASICGATQPSCAPSGWDNVLSVGASENDHPQVLSVPATAVDFGTDHAKDDSHAMVDRPPWEQFDLDANEFLINDYLRYHKDVEGPTAFKLRHCGRNPCECCSERNAQRKTHNQ